MINRRPPTSWQDPGNKGVSTAVGYGAGEVDDTRARLVDNQPRTARTPDKARQCVGRYPSDSASLEQVCLSASRLACPRVASCSKG